MPPIYLDYNASTPVDPHVVLMEAPLGRPRIAHG